jgi:hypothetical protein
MVCNLWLHFSRRFYAPNFIWERHIMPIAVRYPSDPLRHTGACGRQHPFDSAEEAWLWTMATLIARREGARYTAGKGLVSRPCDPDDVVKCLEGLYRQRRINLAHARVLRIWGERQITPSCVVVAERLDYKLWTEALGRLEWLLRIKGIVV